VSVNRRGIVCWSGKFSGPTGLAPLHVKRSTEPEEAAEVAALPSYELEHTEKEEVLAADVCVAVLANE
jgi:hypothetical protein